MKGDETEEHSCNRCEDFPCDCGMDDPEVCEHCFECQNDSFTDEDDRPL